MPQFRQVDKNIHIQALKGYHGDMANSASQSITGSKTLRNKKVQGTGAAGSTSLAKQSANAASLNQKKYGVPPTNGNQVTSLTQGSKTAPNLASKVGAPNMGDM